MADHLKRHLLCVFLSALTYNPSMTLAYLESNQLTEEFFSQLFSLAPSFVNLYERKVFIIGLSNALNAEHLPQSVLQNMLMVMKEVIKMLTTLKETEAKALKKAGKKEIKNEEEDEEEEEEDEDDEDEDEEEEEDVEIEESKGQLTHDLEEDEEDKEEKTGRDDEDDEDSEDEEPEEDEDEVDEVFDLNVTMDMLNAPFKKADEFAIFNHILRALHSKDATYINNMISINIRVILFHIRIFV